jgi:hypothetical protein
MEESIRKIEAEMAEVKKELDRLEQERVNINKQLKDLEKKKELEMKERTSNRR